MGKWLIMPCRRLVLLHLGALPLAPRLTISVWGCCQRTHALKLPFTTGLHDQMAHGKCGASLRQGESVPQFRQGFGRGKQNRITPAWKGESTTTTFEGRKSAFEQEVLGVRIKHDYLQDLLRSEEHTSELQSRLHL